MAIVVSAGAQHEVDDFVTEIFGITDPRRLFDLLQFGVERLAVKQLSGIRIAIFLILDPEVGIGDVAVKNILTILGIGLQVGRLDLLADKFDVFGDQIAFQILKVFFTRLLGNCSRSICCSRT